MAVSREQFVNMAGNVGMSLENRGVPSQAAPQMGGGMNMGGGGGMGGIDQNTIQALAILDMQQTGGKNLSKLSSFQSLMGVGQEKSSDIRKRERLLNQVAPVIGRITISALQAPAGMEGAIKSQLGRIPGVAGGEAESLRRDTQAFARLIASAFASEVGVATDKDVNRWLGMMPQPGDTYEERVERSQKLIQQIISESQSMGVEVPRELAYPLMLLGGGGQPGGMVSEEISPGGAPQKRTLGQKFVESKAVPRIAGGLTGLLAGAVGTPISAIPGAAIGAGSMAALQDLLRPMVGSQKQEPMQALGGAVGSAGQSALDQAIVQLLAPKIKGALTPMSKLGQARGTALEGSSATFQPGQVGSKLSKFATGTGMGPEMQQLGSQAVERYAGAGTMPELMRAIQQAQGTIRGGAGITPAMQQLAKYELSLLQPLLQQGAPAAAGLTKQMAGKYAFGGAAKTLGNQALKTLPYYLMYRGLGRGQ